MNNDRRFIRGTLKVAKKKDAQIGVYQRKWRMWKVWLKIRHIRRINNEIIEAIKKDPERFAKADKFFSLYLDATLNILEKYSILTHQPVRSGKLNESLKMTEMMLVDVTKGLEQQLAAVLAEDLIDLEVEQEILQQNK